MIATAVLGSVHDPDGAALVGGRDVDPVRLGGAQRVKRVQRLTTQAGRELGLRLPTGAADLRDGDVLALDPDGAEGVAVVVTLEATDVLVVVPRSMHEMGDVAHTLGNRHLPAQFFAADSPLGREAGGAAMVVEHDRTVVSHLDAHGIPYTRRHVVLDTPLRHADHSH